MSHHIYTTPAIVLESLPGREADRRYTIFTSEFGVIRATATGVRRGESKLRYALQEFSALSVSLVRGRDIWRVTNASAGENIFWRERANKPAMEMVARVFRLIIRLVPGEEKTEALYNEVASALRFLGEHQLSAESLPLFEQIVVLRMLYHLGYVGAEPSLTPFLSGSVSPEQLESARVNRRKILAAINFSLKESQL